MPGPFTRFDLPPTKQYAGLLACLEAIVDAREFQMKQWPDVNNPDAGGRTSEEWLCLLQAYQNKLMTVYSESKGSTVEGRARMAKYAAIQANLALWLLQATLGPALDDFCAARRAAEADAGS